MTANLGSLDASFLSLVYFFVEVDCFCSPKFSYLFCFWQALIDLKMFEKADDNFKRAIELEPDSGNIYVHRGLVLQISWKFVHQYYLAALLRKI